jgi:hypothetical protein
MGKIYQLLILISALFYITGCSSLLEVDAEGQITGDVLKDTESIQQALVGAYYNLGGTNDGSSGGELFGGDFILIPTLLAHFSGQEYVWTSSQATDYLLFTERDENPAVKILATNARIQQNWVRAYETINMLNTILINLDKITDSNERDRIEGECLAMRGIIYFEMVRLWAPDYQIGSSEEAIPLILDPISEISEISTPTLSSVSEVYTQVQTDLEDASSLLESFDKNGTGINYATCQTYLARLSLHMRNYTDAYDYTDNVLTSGLFSLRPEPYLAFNNPVNSSEDVFAIQQSLNNNSGDRTSGTGIVSFMSSLTESGIGQFIAISSSLNNTTLLNSPRFNIGDQRAGFISNADANTTASDLAQALFYNNIANGEGGFLSSAKYTSASNVIPIVRLAELYLIRSEAEYQANGLTQGAIDDLNEIRNRAGIPTVALSDFTGDPTAFMDSLMLESKREFIYEGHMLHNLRRWEAKIGSDFQQEDPLDYEFIFSIPQSEQDTWTD